MLAAGERTFASEPGEPLDDVIVDFRGATGDLARFSLQVKRSLTISEAKSNTDFRDIIRDSWATLAKDNFRHGVDRYGAAVGTVTPSKARALTTLCYLARESLTTDHFDARFARGGNAGREVEAVKNDIVALLKRANGKSCTNEIPPCRRRTEASRRCSKRKLQAGEQVPAGRRALPMAGLAFEDAATPV